MSYCTPLASFLLFGRTPNDYVRVNPGELLRVVEEDVFGFRVSKLENGTTYTWWVDNYTKWVRKLSPLELLALLPEETQ